MFSFAERQLADRVIDLSNDLRAIALQLLAVDRGRARWPVDRDEQAQLATRLTEVGQQLCSHLDQERTGRAG